SMMMDILPETPGPLISDVRQSGAGPNVLDRRTWTTRQQLRTAIVTWIERTYHRRRRQRSLSRLTPIEYETIMTPPASQAA
ncbi:hypothetical protein ACK8GE_04260, partial [Micromonosporaceae bacterium DT194]